MDVYSTALFKVIKLNHAVLCLKLIPHLRNISGLLIFDNFFEKVNAQLKKRGNTEALEFSITWCS